MQNLLIIENDEKKLKDIFYVISNILSNARIYNISFGGETILEILKSQPIDIVISSFELPGMSGFDILKFVEKEHLYKYKKSIIIFSNNYQIYKNICSEYLFSFIQNDDKYKSLIENLKILVDLKEKSNNIDYINQKIDCEFKKLNFNFSHVGTKYLRETIIEIYKIKDEFEGNLEKNIYPIIAKRYNKKVNTIYCNIKQAINFMILNNTTTNIKKYFHYTYFYKPKTNEIIFTILNKIKNPNSKWS